MPAEQTILSTVIIHPEGYGRFKVTPESCCVPSSVASLAFRCSSMRCTL